MNGRDPHLARRGDPASPVALAQGAYYAVTGVWPWLHMRSFLWATGPKTDLWLVKTVGALVGVSGAALLLAGLRGRVAPEIRLLGAGSAAALAAIDGLYVARRRIPPVYLADAAAEVALLAAWTLAGSGAAGRRDRAARIAEPLRGGPAQSDSVGRPRRNTGPVSRPRP